MLLVEGETVGSFTQLVARRVSLTRAVHQSILKTNWRDCEVSLKEIGSQTSENGGISISGLHSSETTDRHNGVYHRWGGRKLFLGLIADY